jgi:hypothetical protein
MASLRKKGLDNTVQTTTYRYDQRGVMEMTTTDPNVDRAMVQTMSRDSAGDAIEILDWLGRVTTLSYETVRGQRVITAITSPVSPWVTYEYNESTGRLIEVAVPENRIRVERSDAMTLGTLISYMHPRGRFTETRAYRDGDLTDSYMSGQVEYRQRFMRIQNDRFAITAHDPIKMRAAIMSPSGPTMLYDGTDVTHIEYQNGKVTREDTNYANGRDVVDVRYHYPAGSSLATEMDVTGPGRGTYHFSAPLPQ